MTTKVHNISPVIAEWDFKRLFGDARDEARFKMTPRGGSLHRDQRVNVQVEFAPTDDRMYSLKMAVRVASATKNASVVLQGRGAQPRVRFDPPMLDMGPVLPNDPQGDSREVTLFNDSAWDVEIFSLDFDKTYLEEEEILSRATCFAADEVLRLPPRLPGQRLHQSLIDAARAQDEATRRAERREAKNARSRAREAAAVDAVATTDAGGDGAGGEGGGEGAEGVAELSEEDADHGEENNNIDNGGGVFNIDGGEAAAAAAAAYGDEPWLETPEEVLERCGGAGSDAIPEWDRVPTAREKGKAHDVVVTGPPLSGKSTLSRALGARYHLPALTVDGAVREALRLRNKLGTRVRAAIHRFTAKEQVRWVRDVEAARQKVAAEAAEPTPVLKGNKKAAVAAAAAAATANEAGPPEAVLALQALQEPQGLSAELLTEVLQWRLAKSDCDRGVILDGLDSSLAARDAPGLLKKVEGDGATRNDRAGTSVAVVAKAASGAMPNARLLVLRFKDEEGGYTARLNRLTREATETLAALGDEFEDQLSAEDLGFVEPLSCFDSRGGSKNARPGSEGGGEFDMMEDNGENMDGDAAMTAGEGDDVLLVDCGKVGAEKAEAAAAAAAVADITGGVPVPHSMNVEEPSWDARGDCVPLPAWKELSEAELWALDDKQRDEHFRMDERRRRTELDRARRITDRVNLLHTRAAAAVTTTATAMITASPPASPPSPLQEKGGGGAAKDAKGGASGPGEVVAKEATATKVTPSAYIEFIQVLMAVVAPIFEHFASSSAPGAPDRLGASRQRRGGGGGGDGEHEVAVDSGSSATSAGGSHCPNPDHAADGGSLAGDSLARDSLASDSVTGIGGSDGGTAASMSVIRMIELHVTGESQVAIDTESALALLPEPAVPAPDPKLVAIPPEKVRQQVRRPVPRAQRQPLQKLEILPVQGEEVPPPSSRAESRKAAKARLENRPKTEPPPQQQQQEQQHHRAASAKDKDDGFCEGTVRTGAPSGALEGNSYRWVIRSGDSIRFVVKFSSPSAGVFDLPLTFEAVGTGRRYTLHVSGTCAFPSINADPRNVFMRRVKHRAQDAVPPVSKRFVISRGQYEFGPLLIWKRAENRIPPKVTSEEKAAMATGGAGGGGKMFAKVRAKEEAHNALASTNAETFRLSNDGKFPVKVTLAFEEQPQDKPSFSADETVQAATAVAIADGGDSGAAGYDDGNSLPGSSKRKTFYVEPETLELAIGETAEVRVWAFPTEVKEYKDTLVACLTDNPRPVLFPVSCSGATPSMVLEGPWDEVLLMEQAALEELGSLEDLPEDAPPEAREELEAALLAAETRVRETKESGAVIDFDRLLLGRVESREFVVRNASQVPCRWRVDASHPAFLENSDDFRVIPGAASEGVVEVGGTTRVTVMFSAGKEGVFEPILAIEYTDNEIGFGEAEDGRQGAGGGGEGGRVVRHEVKIVAEAYCIRAVAFETPDEAAHAEQEVAEAAALTTGKAGAVTRKAEKGSGKGPVSDIASAAATAPAAAEQQQQPRKNDGSLDFGRQRVGDAAAERFTLRNRGKYDIAFAFRMKRGIVASLFKVEPSQGVVGPGQAAEVCVTFCSREETHLKDNRDIRCVITEPHTGEAVEEFSVVVSAVSTWSRFRLQPRRGINFGPVAFNADSITKTFELKNEGEFEFVFAVQGKGLPSTSHEAAIRQATPNALLPPEEQAPQELKAGAPVVPEKGGAKGKGKGAAAASPVSRKGSKGAVTPTLEVPADPLSLGRFYIAPSGGLVQPGQSVSVTVRYNPENANAHRESLCLKVSGSDPSDGACALAASYDLLAESCVPGIVTSDWRDIFEEQSVIPSLAGVMDDAWAAAAAATAGGSGRGGGDGDGAGGGSGGGGRAGGRVCFAEEQRMFTFGSVVSSQIPIGISERFKISNSNKIPCTVKFGISPAASPKDSGPPPIDSKAKKGKGAKGAEEEEAPGKADVTAFAVHPETWEIPPHEHRYVSAHFRPTEMRSYRCQFEAVVLDNNDSSTGRLSFLLSGKGTMPTVTLESPLERDQSGAVIMDFGEVCARKSRRIPLVLRNDGMLPVSCLFDLELPDAQGGGVTHVAESVVKKRNRQRKGDFLFAAAGGSVTLLPRERKPMEVIFQPRCKPTEGKPESLHTDLKMTVLHNPFDATVFKLSGTCLSHDVVFDDLPGESVVDELTFEQVDILGLPAPDGNDSAAATTTKSTAVASGGGDDGAKFAAPAGTGAQGPACCKEITFCIWNQGASPCRFLFSSHKHFKFSPSIGHLPVGSRCEIRATFHPLEPVKYENEPVEFMTQKIRYPEPTAAEDEGDDAAASHGQEQQKVHERRTSLHVDFEWDDSKTQLREASEEDMRVLLQEEAATAKPAVAEKNKKAAKKGKEPLPPDIPAAPTLRRGPVSDGGVQMVYAVQAEPRFEPVEGMLPSKRPLRCSGVADRARFEIVGGVLEGTSALAFSNTAMFQCRVHVFTVRNPGTTRLPYEWSLTNRRNSSRDGSTARLGSQLQKSRSLAFVDLDVGGRVGGASGGGAKLMTHCPFSVEPYSGEIEGGGEQSFAVRFAPQEVDDFLYALSARMPTLPTDQAPLSLTLRGRSLRPVCHFALQESPDYLQRRQSHLLANDLGQQGLAIEATSVRVVEVTSRGTQVRNTKRFYVVNPTNVGYDFSWESQGNLHPSWRCVTQRGMVLAGKRGEMVFEFTPEDMNVAEAFYRFRIPEHGVSELFLFAGGVVEPDITVDRTKLDYGALMLGAALKQTFHIVNREAMPHSFVFDKNSLGMVQVDDDPRRRAVLEVSPTSGLLPPNGRVTIEVTFCPREEKFHNFNLIFGVRKKQTKLSINVKGEGFKVHAKLLIQGKSGADEGGAVADAAAGESGAGGAQEEGGGGGRGADGGGSKATVALELLPFPQINVVDFGSIHINERAARKITIVNPGKFSVEYLWQWRTPSGPALRLSGAKQAGSVKKGDRVELSLDFLPTGEIQLDGQDLICTVAGRYEYVLRIVGRGIRPGLHFSFLKHDFGPCFITPAGSIPNPECVTLKVTNRDPSAALSLDCLHQGDRCFWATSEPSVLEAGQTLDIPLYFAPRDARQYAFGVPFLVNGSYTVKLLVVGEGCPARLELANLAQKHLTFGMVPEGQQVSKQVKLVNRSKRAIEFELVDTQDLGTGRLEAKGVRFAPALPTTLGSRESIMVDVYFFPEMRMPSFTETLFVRAGATSELNPLLLISGQSTGMEVALAVDALPFGTVCACSQRTQRLGLENRGDLPARFRWNEETFGPHFSVSPLEGIVAPLTETGINVIFTPQSVDDDIRTEGVLCMVEGHPPLALTLTGSCVSQPSDSVHLLSFKSRARVAAAQWVTLENPTDKNWFITPVLKGEHWQGAGQLQVPAKGTADYTIEFFPLSMTSSSPPPPSPPPPTNTSDTRSPAIPSGGGGGSRQRQQDTSQENEYESSSDTAIALGSDGKPTMLSGSLFFALPNGGAVLYRLEGEAAGPEAASSVELETPAKTALAFTLPVANWLRRGQRFTMKAVLGEGAFPSTALSGAKTIEVPALATKDFPLRFLAFKEGVTTATVTFTNDDTGEYLFHRLTLTATPPNVQETIVLEGSVRSLTRRLITVANPLRPDEPITFPAGNPAVGGITEGWWRCSSPHVRLVRVGEMAGNLEGVFAVDYRPLVATDDQKPEEADLSFDIQELGTYRYTLHLSANPPPSSSSLHFESALGATQSEAFVMKVFNCSAAEPVNFECRLEGGQGAHFRVPPKVTAPLCASWDGQDVRVEICFEPECTGEVEDTLIVSSARHGSYRCKLKGLCSPPLPQGPFTIAPGGQREISFRNVFAAEMSFTFTCDNPAFAVISGDRQNIAAKTSTSVAIKFTPPTQATGGSSSTSAVAATAATATAEAARSVAGKLIVQCAGVKGTPPWVFYLHGISPPPAQCV